MTNEIPLTQDLKSQEDTKRREEAVAVDVAVVDQHHITWAWAPSTTVHTQSISHLPKVPAVKFPSS